MNIKLKGKAKATPYAKQLTGRLMFYRGAQFYRAAVLLENSDGSDRAAVLHLLCQGLEIVVKGILQYHNFTKYNPLLIYSRKAPDGIGHDLLKGMNLLTVEFPEHVLDEEVRSELIALNKLYMNQLLKYASLSDLFGDVTEIKFDRVAAMTIKLILFGDRLMTPPSDPLPIPSKAVDS